MTTFARDVQARQRWMSILARATPGDVEAAWDALADRPVYRLLRGPEVGLVMVRGRAGGTGVRFNLGETTVTRCTVELDDGTTGHAYVHGRHLRHAELAAALDAMLQDPLRHAAVAGRVVDRLADEQAARRRTAEARAAATRVEFLTLVRGED
jgi:alpha-D-ribose 1-methylphosphonate 5-triphosphate synthase subunit PhnG